MIAAAVVGLQALCCIGLGTILLRLLKLVRALSLLERVAWSFVLGLGVLGWLMFFVGIVGGFRPAALWSILTLGACGCLLLRTDLPSSTRKPLTSAEYVCAAALVLSGLFDLFEALAPAADADSMAYHFALPRLFSMEGALTFVPLAVDGAIPLLVQMTYVPPFDLGGEHALTLWTGLSGWGLILLSYVISRKFLDRIWSLVFALLLATTPAIVYSAGAGHVEVRMASFSLLAAYSLAEGLRRNDLRFVAIAGATVGMAVGSKYSGPLFAAALVLTLIGLFAVRYRRWAAPAACCVGMAVLFGSQWYVWNWLHTGDPLFPVLFGILPYSDPTIWDAAHQQAVITATAINERGVPINLWWMLIYPFVATLHGLPVFESGRTGFGPFLLLVLPMMCLAVWVSRTRLSRSIFWPMLSTAVAFYLLWFLSGFSQRIRHLLPIYPIVLLCGLAAAVSAAHRFKLAAPLAAATILSCSIQLAGQFVFTRGFIVYLFSDQTRETFLERNIPGYPMAAWINSHLGSGDKVFTTERQLIYQFDVPVFYGRPVYDARVDVRPEANDPPRLLRQLKRQNITHVLISTDQSGNSPDSQWQFLIKQDCLRTVHAFNVENFESRTLPTLGRDSAQFGLFKLDFTDCPAFSEEG